MDSASKGWQIAVRRTVRTATEPGHAPDAVSRSSFRPEFSPHEARGMRAAFALPVVCTTLQLPSILSPFVCTDSVVKDPDR